MKQAAIVDIVAVLFLACLLQVLAATIMPGISGMQGKQTCMHDRDVRGCTDAAASLAGYLEWHITNVCITTLLNAGVNARDIVTGAAASLLLLQWGTTYGQTIANKQPQQQQPHSAVAFLRTVDNVAVLVATNAAVTWWSQLLQGWGAMGSPSVIMASVVMAQFITRLVQRR